MTSPRPHRRLMRPWLISLLAGCAAVIAIAGPAAAPPHPTAPASDAAAQAAALAQPAAAQTVVGQTAVGLLTVSQTATLEELPIGGSTIIQITVRNAGSITTSGTILQDDLPNGLAFVEADPQPTSTGGSIIWSLGAMAPGDLRDITLTVRGTAAGTLTNRVAVRSDATDEVVDTAALTVTNTGLSPGVSQTPASAPMNGNELAATGATLNWLIGLALAMVAVGAFAVESASRLPAMASLTSPRRRRRANRPVFHPVRSSRYE